MTPSIQGYDVLDRLGEGGMALVFRAWSHARQDFAVIKLLSPDLDDSPMLRQRWATEAKLGQWLDHPSIARILDSGQTQQAQSFLAMEYVSGQTISGISDALKKRQRRFPPHLVMAVAKSVLHALEFVHTAENPKTGRPLSIVHRDLKPANVMVTYEGAIKVLDFGVARTELGELRTQTGMLTGTPAYMSPEQVMADKRIDRRSDIYSWAAVVHELLVGRPLVGDLGERIEQLKAVLTEPPPLVQPVIPELTTAAVDNVLQKALAKEPEDRFGSAASFWLALEAAASPELGVGHEEELGRLVRSLFPGGLEKERLLRAQPRARSAPLTELRPKNARPPAPDPSLVQPQPMDERPPDPGPLPPSPVEVPPAVAGYVVKGRLGEGGTGMVFLVEHIDSGAERALKLLRPELAGHPDVRRRFSVEAQLGQAIEHPGVVRVLEVGEDSERRPFMVMERVVGQDLAQWLRRLDGAGRRMAPQAALRISLDVLEVLDYVHRLKGPHGSLGIVHRDLKPSNVMISPAGRVKVLDFGIARAWLGQQRTRTGYRSGTELYMSPEQALARKDLDHRSDVYSWAVVLFELLAGRPLLDVGAAEVLPHLVHTPPLELLRPLSEIAPQLKAPLARALAKEPSDRFPSAAAFATALREAAPDLFGMSAEDLGRLWQADPPSGLEHVRGPVDERPEAAEAPTDGLPVLPGYVVKKKLDEGGCGELWLATKGTDATWWVIKTLRSELAVRPDIQRRFEREVRILAELDHPHVVRVHGARRTADGRLFTVMQYIRGIDFERILYHFRVERRLLPPDIPLRVILDVLLGLHAAHELTEDGRPVGVVHRDLSPRNLMVDADGTTKVIDFGLAAAQISVAPSQTRADVGTPRFWSPEQARGLKSIDRRSDVYVAAVILYEALTGQPLAPFAEVTAVRRAVLHDRPPPVHEVVSQIPVPLGRVIAKAMAKDPNERWPTADAFRQALVSAWAERPLRTHDDLAAFLKQEGPKAYAEAADRSPVADGRLPPTAQRAPTSDGRPADLTQDALHPPTRLGSPPRPRSTSRWVLGGSAAAVVAVAVALTVTTPTPPTQPEPAARAVGPERVRSVAREAAPPVPSPVARPGAPATAAPIARTVGPEARAPKPKTAPRPVLRSKPAAPPNNVPSIAKAPPHTARVSAKAVPPPRPEPPSPTQAPTRGRPRPWENARNKMEAEAMLREAALAAEKNGQLDAEARAELDDCVARLVITSKERLVRECGRLLRR